MSSDVTVSLGLDGEADRELVAAARAFAIAAHGAQLYGRGDNARPYVVHLDEVAGVVRELAAASAGALGLAAAYLHDVVEDTGVSPAQIEAAFPGQNAAALARIVAFCTDAPGASRKERKAATYARMRAEIDAGPPFVAVAVQVKLADRIANLRACHRDSPSLLEMYRKEDPSFRAALHVPAMCDAMWSAYERLVAGGAVKPP